MIALVFLLFKNPEQVPSVVTDLESGYSWRLDNATVHEDMEKIGDKTDVLTCSASGDNWVFGYRDKSIKLGRIRQYQNFHTCLPMMYQKISIEIGALNTIEWLSIKETTRECISVPPKHNRTMTMWVWRREQRDERYMYWLNVEETTEAVQLWYKVFIVIRIGGESLKQNEKESQKESITLSGDAHISWVCLSC